MSYIQPSDRHQATLMNSLDDLISSRHPVRLLDKLVDGIVKQNPDRFGVEPVGDVGRPHYSHSTLIKLHLYGNINGIRSSRKLETETHRNIELIWLLGELKPDHWTIAQYRKCCGEQITFVAREFRHWLHQYGYITAEHMAVDGSKVKANAARTVLTDEKIVARLAHLDTQIEEYLGVLAENDHREDVIDDFSDQATPDVRESALIDKIVALQQKVEELSQHKEHLERHKDQTYLSPADPEAMLMKSRDGKHPAYNVQLAVDAKHGFIVADEVLTDANDLNALPVVVNAIEEVLGIVPASLSADKGYYTPDQIEQIEQNYGTRCYVAVKESSKDSSPEAVTFRYDKEQDCYWCSEGKPLPLNDRNMKLHKSVVNRYRGTQCQECFRKAHCTTSRSGRQITRYENHDWRQRYRERMNAPIAKFMLRLRKCLAEHPFGVIKCLGGKIPLLLRGKAKVATEITLLTTAFNLKRLFNLSPFEKILAQFVAHRWATG
jgi:transposase